MKKVRLLLTVSFMVFIVLGVMSSASALLITPATIAAWSGDVPKNPKAGDIPDLVGYEGSLYEFYKQDLDGPESGTYAGSYATAFFKAPMDPKDATITYVSGPIISSGDPLYLLLKDGNHSPISYIFELSGWNGTETIYLQDFWPDQGATSLT